MHLRSPAQNDRKRIDYILTRQAHRSRVHVKVHPRPTSRDKPDSDRNMVCVTVDLSGRCAPNRQARNTLKDRLFDRRVFVIDGECRKRLVSRVVSDLNQPTQPNALSDVADVFTMAIIDAVKVNILAEPRRHRKRGWCESTESSAAFKIAWTARENARKLIDTLPRERTAWKTLRTTCANLRKVIDAGVHSYSNRMLLKWRKYSPKTTSRVSTST